MMGHAAGGRVAMYTALTRLEGGCDGGSGAQVTSGISRATTIWVSLFSQHREYKKSDRRDYVSMLNELEYQISDFELIF